MIILTIFTYSVLTLILYRLYKYTCYLFDNEQFYFDTPSINIESDEVMDDSKLKEQLNSNLDEFIKRREAVIFKFKNRTTPLDDNELYDNEIGDTDPITSEEIENLNSDFHSNRKDYVKINNPDLVVEDEEPDTTENLNEKIKKYLELRESYMNKNK